MASDLPDGFTLDTHPAVQTLPDGFTIDAPTSSAQTYSVGSDGQLTPKTGPGSGGYTSMPTAFPGFQMGLGDPLVGATQLAAHALNKFAPSLAPKADEMVRQREAEYQNTQNVPAPAAPYASGVFNADAPGGPVYVPPTTPTGATYGNTPFDTGRALGNIAMTAPLGAMMPGASSTGLLPRTISAAATGGITAALNPTDLGDTQTENDFWKQKATQAGTGALTAGGLTAGGSALANVVQPNVNPNVALLMSKGVRPTPGQILGGSANRLEEAATSIPLIGDAIKNARYGAVQEFNRGAINDALAPIGETLGKDTPLGRQAIDEAATKISDAYNRILPQLSPQADQPFLNNMNTLVQMSRSMPPDRAAQFQGILKNTIFDRMSPGGGMTGQGFKDADSQLGSMVRSYRNAPDPDIRQLGDGLLQAQTELRSMVSRSNPALAPALDANNKAYSTFLRVQAAAARPGAEDGVFTPAQLSSAVRQLDPTLRHSGFARGSAVMQDLSDAGKSVLGSKVPDSGTPLRGAAMAIPALVAAGSYSPLAAAGAAAGGAGLLGAYSQWGRTGLAHLLASRPAMAAPIANAIRSTGPLTSLAGGLLPTWLGR